MREKQSFTEKLLLLIADFIDFNRQPVTWHSLHHWFSNNPKYRPLRAWLEEYFRKRKKRTFYSTISRLNKNGYLKIRTAKEGKGYILTPKGEKKILENKVKNLKLKLDPFKYWLMIVFDIPEKRRKDRDLFRIYLYELGFQKIQQSIWISPYNVYKELKEIVNNLGLNQCVKFLKVKEIGKF